jgi:hypothetical protein
MSRARPAPATAVLRPATMVQGEAVFPDGRPVAGLTVLGMAIMHTDGGASSALLSDTVRRADTDAQGRFEIGPFAPGAVQLLATTDPAYDPTKKRWVARQRVETG